MEFYAGNYIAPSMYLACRAVGKSEKMRGGGSINDAGILCPPSPVEIGLNDLQNIGWDSAPPPSSFDSPEYMLHRIDLSR